MKYVLKSRNVPSGRKRCREYPDPEFRLFLSEILSCIIDCACIRLAGDISSYTLSGKLINSRYNPDKWLGSWPVFQTGPRFEYRPDSIHVLRDFSMKSKDCRSIMPKNGNLWVVLRYFVILCMEFEEAEQFSSHELTVPFFDIDQN